MNKICTTLKQSKKLIELGIDINTADMYYQWYSETESALHVGKGSKNLNADCPAWSLAALFDFLPEHIQVSPSLKQSKYMCNYHNGIVEFGDDYHKEKSTNLFDAVFEMVCWLKENGKL